MKTFIKLGNDRIRLEHISSYGIKMGVRYLVKRANMVPVEKKFYESAFWGFDPEGDPILDIYDRPVKINGETAQYGSLKEDEFIVEESRVFYVNLKYENIQNEKLYYEQTADFSFEEKLAELDEYFLK